MATNEPANGVVAPPKWIYHRRYISAQQNRRYKGNHHYSPVKSNSNTNPGAPLTRLRTVVMTPLCGYYHMSIHMV